MIESPYIMGVRAREHYEQRAQQLDAEMDAAQMRGDCDGWRVELIEGINHASEMERSDPEPTLGAFCRCANCLAYYMAAGE